MLSECFSGILTITTRIKTCFIWIVFIDIGYDIVSTFVVLADPVLFPRLDFSHRSKSHHAAWIT